METPFKNIKQYENIHLSGIILKTTENHVGLIFLNLFFNGVGGLGFAVLPVL
jgi:hypothetical protein